MGAALAREETRLVDQGGLGVGKLVHFQPDGSPVEIRLDRQRITIGRRPDNDICLPYPAVSGEHAVILTILDDSFLEDLGSTNGTLVNGVAVAKYFLRDRDEIDVGRHVLVYCADDAATVDRPSLRTRSDGASRGEQRADYVQPVPVSQRVLARVADDDASSGVATTAEFPRAAESLASAAVETRPPRPPYQFIDGEPALKVVSGAKAGRIVALVKDETLIGRPGVQVVALRRARNQVHIVPIEGATPPSVNGVLVVPEGESLALGDIVELAGAKLEVIVPTKRPSA
jgi:pSer/pThr/pTyr-binding forkhead associated (FHA) protein